MHTFQNVRPCCLTIQLLYLRSPDSHLIKLPHSRALLAIFSHRYPVSLYRHLLTNRNNEASHRCNASMVLVTQTLSPPHPQPSTNLTPNLRVSKLTLAYLSSSIVVSVFAIVILSVIGALFKSNHHSLMGSTGDPPVDQGAAVAATVFSAVIVYAVRPIPSAKACGQFGKGMLIKVSFETNRSSS